MLAILNAITALGLLAMLPLYVMYFVALHHFGQSLRERHPGIHARFAAGHLAPLADSYAALRALRADTSLAATLEPPVAAALRDTYRYLVVCIGCFMVVLFAGLGSSLIAKA